MPFILHNSGPEGEIFYWSGQLWNHRTPNFEGIGCLKTHYTLDTSCIMYTDTTSLHIILQAGRYLCSNTINNLLSSLRFANKMDKLT